MSNVDLADIERRPQRYWNVDGLPELTMGTLWMIWGGAWLFGQQLPRGRVYTAFWLVVPALLAVSGVAAAWATRRLKERVTFPRTGYVAWREPSRAARLGVAAISIVTAAVLAAVAIKARTEASAGQVAAPILGVVLSLAFLVAAVRQQAPHYLALAGVAIALGIALGSRASGWESANWLFVGIGAATALVGTARLVVFLKQNPPRTVEDA